MKKYIFLFVITIELLAQNTALNHSKYWFYRYRLRNEFLTLGMDPCGVPSGKMLPVINEKRKDTGFCYCYPYIYLCV